MDRVGAAVAIVLLGDGLIVRRKTAGRRPGHRWRRRMLLLVLLLLLVLRSGGGGVGEGRVRAFFVERGEAVGVVMVDGAHR